MMSETGLGVAVGPDPDEVKTPKVVRGPDPADVEDTKALRDRDGVAVKDTKVVRGLPLVGGLIGVFRDGPGFMTRMAREHPGEIVGIRLGPTTVYLVTHPDHI